MNFPKVLLFATLAAIFLAHVGSAEVCLSSRLYKSELDQVISEARKADKDISAIRCMEIMGMAFKPKDVQLSPGRLIKCYEERDVENYLIEIVESCIRKFDHTERDTKGLAQAVDDEITQKTGRPVINGTIRASCHCTSGCHWCCVAFPKAPCFVLWCRGQGYCY